MRRVGYLLIVLGFVVLLLPVFLHAEEIKNVAGLASGTDLTKSINRFAKTDVDEKLEELIYRSLPDKKKTEIEYNFQNIELGKLIKFVFSDPFVIFLIIFVIFLIILVVMFFLFLYIGTVFFAKSGFSLFTATGISFLVCLTVVHFLSIPFLQAKSFIESRISPRSVVIETTNNSSITARIQDVIVLKDGRLFVDTAEKGSVITDFKSVKLL